MDARRYGLLLKEFLKHTLPDAEDYAGLKLALEKVRNSILE